MSKSLSRTTQEAPSDKWPVPAKVIAEIVGCEESTVRKVRTGKRGKRNTKTTENIRIAELLIDDRKNQLIQEVKRIVKF